MLSFKDIEKLLMLDKTQEELQKWEESAFDDALESSNGQVILFGTGQIGRDILADLRALRIEPIAFIDNDAQKWSTKIDGLIVLSPEEGVMKYGDSLFLTSMHVFARCPHYNAFEQLQKLGCKNIISYIYLQWKTNKSYCRTYPLEWLMRPSQIMPCISDIVNAYLIIDEKSRSLFIELIRSRVFGNINAKIDISPQVPYFDDAWKVTEDERFVDCGAFDGDTLKDFLKIANGKFDRVYAFEPDLLNVQKLLDYLQTLDESIANKISVYPYAVGNEHMKVPFVSDGGLGGGKISRDGDVYLNSVCLDDILFNQKPTFIKMDIESFELNAIMGSTRIIRRYKPNLAICVYHKYSDLWKIPLMINEICPEFNFHIRIYENFDIVCYAMSK